MIHNGKSSETIEQTHPESSNSFTWLFLIVTFNCCVVILSVLLFDIIATQFLSDEL